MNHEEFEAWLQSLETREKKLDPHKDRILHWLREYPDAQILDWLEEKLDVTNVSEGTVRNYVNELREIHHIPKTANYRVYTAVEELPPSVQCQVDFGETVLLTEYGDRRKVYCIRFVLAHSRYKYAEWLDRPFRTVDVIRMHENASRFYDGMPEKIVYDRNKLQTVSENCGRPPLDWTVSVISWLSRFPCPSMPNSRSQVKGEDWERYKVCQIQLQQESYIRRLRQIEPADCKMVGAYWKLESSPNSKKETFRSVCPWKTTLEMSLYFILNYNLHI